MLNIYIFIYLFHSFYQINCQSIITNSNTMAIRIDTNSANILLTNQQTIQSYIVLKDRTATIFVTCTQKIPRLGTIEALVNSQTLNKINECYLYSITSNNERVCVQAIFIYYAQLNDGNLNLDFECRIKENSLEDNVKRTVKQLVLDSQAKIRNGISTDAVGQISTYTTIQKIISCEGVQNTFDKIEFDSVAWYGPDDKKLNFQTNRIQIINNNLINVNIFNLTSEFKITETTTPGSYKCCTTLRDNQKLCQSMNLIRSGALTPSSTVINPTTSTVINPTTSTTKNSMNSVTTSSNFNQVTTSLSSSTTSTITIRTSRNSSFSIFNNFNHNIFLFIMIYFLIEKF